MRAEARPIDGQRRELRRLAAAESFAKGRERLLRRQRTKAERGPFRLPRRADMQRHAGCRPRAPVYAECRQAEAPPILRERVEESVGGGVAGETGAAE